MYKEEKEPICLTLDEIEALLERTPLTKTEVTTALIIIQEGNEAKQEGNFTEYLEFANKRLDFVNEIYKIFKEVILEGEEEHEEVNC